MKMRVTLEDIKQLNETQKRWLVGLWKPQKYDVAVASMCMDVENEIYDEFEFVVGRVDIDKHANIYLHDIRSMPVDSEETANEEDALEKNPDYNRTGSEASISQSSTGLFNTAVKNLEIPFSDTSTPDDTEDTDAEDEYFEDADDETDFDMTYSRPSFFSKDDCVPLMNIGQLIEILGRFDFGKGDFYLTASNGEIGCELGKDASTWEDYRNYESRELCDVLWELVKAVLE